LTARSFTTTQKAPSEKYIKLESQPGIDRPVSATLHAMILFTFGAG